MVVEQMQIDEKFLAQLSFHQVSSCNTTLAFLIKQIGDLPENARGPEAMRMAAGLVELAAYELAARIDSKETAALIRCAAELSQRSEELRDARNVADHQLAEVLQ
jgi:hypothetical protein